MTDATPPAGRFIPLRPAPQDHLTPATTAPPAPTPPPAPSFIDIPDDSAPIPIRLVGVLYQAHAPKSMLAIRLGQEIDATDFNDLAAIEARMAQFIQLIFSPADESAILARLYDPADPLDLRHLMALVQQVTAYVTGVPPTSPGGSEASPSGTGSTSTATPSPTASETSAGSPPDAF